MQAVIRTGAKQYLVQPDQTLEIDLVGSDAKTLEFQPLLVIDGDKVSVGTPTVAGVTVTAKVVGEVKGEKLKILKFKPKKRIKKQTGHRQRYTQITITGIGAAKAGAASKSKTAAAAS
ncbi:MAG TPA: 50S ribosomal protein L21 [Candidatus Saccharimonadales bacterium]|nr:50S ribosomal protein L21 [Candidatus Saccharimonadales bacterium]